MFSSLLVCEIRKCRQRVSPHGIDVGAQLSQALWIEAKVMASATPFFFDQAGGFQHLKMLRNSGTTDRKLSRQFTDGGGPLAQQVENSLASRIRESTQEIPSVSHNLP
jgi:hypothetical protein